MDVGRHQPPASRRHPEEAAQRRPSKDEWPLPCGDAAAIALRGSRPFGRSHLRVTEKERFRAKRRAATQRPRDGRARLRLD
jgi:hypothetical protein